MITKNTRLPFGKHKGRKLKNCPISYLKWVSEHLVDSDFHNWAVKAKEIFETHKKEDEYTDNLEKAADDFLRKHGIDPNNL
jgi:hypothetical protein